ncbi:MAG: hypothetical protein ACE37F_33025 [Nannocystaceae bacterium]|nr:hypothetical protein [bacterium]
MIISGEGSARLTADPPTDIELEWQGKERRYTWPDDYAGKLAILVMRGNAPLRPLGSRSASQSS